MSAHDRRHFLKLLALSASSAAMADSLSSTIRRALAIPAARRSGTLMDVEHVVILMQENRSFDHYFGTLRGVRGFGDPRPLILPNGRTVFHQPRLGLPGSNYVLPFHLDSQRSRALCMLGLDHSWKGLHTLWKDHNAWVMTKTSRTMGYFKRQDIPFYHALADAFTICDGYHCSIHGPTDPNRLYLFSGTSGQSVSNGNDGNWTADMGRDARHYRGYTWPTTAERLQRQGVSWQVYQEYDNYGDNALAYFQAFRKLDPSSEAYRRGRAIVPGSNARNCKTTQAQPLVDAFSADVQAGRLPQVSWIVAPEDYCEHPRHSPVYGEWLVARLLAALVANPDVWSKTLFLLNYDENDGFFDHQPSPVPALNSLMGLSTVSSVGESFYGVPIGLGIRVPMLLVSPWSKGGWVCSEQFDHTSVLRFLERRFGIEETNITPWRRAVTGDLTSALDFAHPDASVPSLPDPASYLAQAQVSCALAWPRSPNKQSQPLQEPGLRPARALPYEIQVHGRADLSGGHFNLEFINSGRAGVCLIVYSSLRPDSPWHYTLEPGKTLSGSWNGYLSGKRYQLRVMGPNGFLREFNGVQPNSSRGAQAVLEVRASYGTQPDLLTLTLFNQGHAPCVVVVEANHYSRERPRRFSLAAGASINDTWNISASAHWYDLSVRVQGDPAYLRRLAGHRETGRPSWSDPAINHGLHL